MSNAYQNYSDQNKSKEAAALKKYLNNQIALYKNKSKKSLKVAQEYAFDQDLSILDSRSSFDKQFSKNDKLNYFLGNDSQNFDNNLITNQGIEKARVSAANLIKRIDLKINKIKNLKDDLDTMQFFGYAIPELAKDGFPEELDKIQAQILISKEKYTENDPFMQKLFLERRVQIELLREKVLSYLNSQRISAEAIMEAAMRPKGVLLKYKELMREAERDEQTLISLENKLNEVMLAEAKSADPYLLITKPTLLRNPASPKPSIILSLFTIFGILAGSLYCFIKEKRSNYIFEKKDLENALKAEILDEINLGSRSFKNYSQTILLDEIIGAKSNEIIHILFIGEINENDKNNCIEMLSNNKKNFSVETPFLKLAPQDKIILLTKLENLKFNHIHAMNRRMYANNLNLSGIILIN